MKTAISIPDPLFRSAERLADKLGISRSELCCRAVKTLFERHEQGSITRRLNEIYTALGVQSRFQAGSAARRLGLV